MKIIERSHDSEQINAMANTTNSMVDLYAQLAVAKSEQGAQISQLNTKIDRPKKLIEKLQLQHPQQPRQRGESDIARSAKNATK